MRPIGAELKKGKFTHVNYRFSLEKARRKLLPSVTDRVLKDMLCFRGELTLGVRKIPFLEFSPTSPPSDDKRKGGGLKIIDLRLSGDRRSIRGDNKPTNAAGRWLSLRSASSTTPISG